ncbi:hypothetical protein B0H66DRAFT_599742 [Apodospora peruviana]|uniref:WW domain-containing protein n=1 Tax=Apodospora peruviana TaxID=516989 RepID=A0AAE0III7_9PEZI|nr:hypothetical protein B0H66DRAFT_599742 [Apodospora peruviana]
MASLPENWESDYDGNRWYFRFKPTGFIQYTFPRPGDEYPEYIDVFSPAPELSPEEKLESYHQVKRKNTSGENTSKSSATRRKDGLTSATLSGPEDDGASFWLQPDSLMYMGPGAYTDISPPEEEEDGELAGSTSRTKSKQPEKSYISPVTSAEATPQAGSSRPATSTPGTNIVTTVDVGDAVRIDFGAAESPASPGVPMLDGRQIQSPVGHVPELASEQTAQCQEEIHPPPIELPSQSMMIDAAAKPTSYLNAFDIAPVELPAHRSPVQHHVRGNVGEQKVLIPPAQHYPHVRLVGSQNASREQENLQAPVRQNSMPLPVAGPSQSFTLKMR